MEYPWAGIVGEVTFTAWNGKAERMVGFGGTEGEARGIGGEGEEGQSRSFALYSK